MYLKYLVLAMFGLMVVDCQPVNSRKVTNNTIFIDNPLRTDVGCRRQINKTDKNVWAKCMPKDTLVNLQHKYAFVTVRPSKIFVKLCVEDSCDERRFSCVPVETRTIEIPVYLFDISNTKSCNTTTIEEHTKCQCRCKLRKEDCKGIFNKNECSCKCDDSKKAMCEKEGNSWDDDTCTCRCKDRSDLCSTGTTWDSSSCKCKAKEP